MHDVFRRLIKEHDGAELSEYNLRHIGSEIEGTIRKLLLDGELSYNPNCRVLNFSMGLPRTSDQL